MEMDEARYKLYEIAANYREWDKSESSWSSIAVRVWSFMSEAADLLQEQDSDKIYSHVSGSAYVLCDLIVRRCRKRTWKKLDTFNFKCILYSLPEEYSKRLIKDIVLRFPKEADIIMKDINVRD